MPGSKSMAQRLMLAWALTTKECCVSAHSEADDVTAMAGCVREIFDAVYRKKETIEEPLKVKESAAVLRFIMPVLGALGISADLRMEGRLSERPMDVYISQLAQHGMKITRPEGDVIRTEGQLLGGIFELPGDQSSQFISGLLMALPLIGENSELKVIGEIQSRPYVDMTLEVLRMSGIDIIEEEPGNFYIPGGQKYSLEGEFDAEGDWSSAAFWLSMGAASVRGTRITVSGMDPASLHGDREIMRLLSEMGTEISWEGQAVTAEAHDLRAGIIDARNVPDLVPALIIASVKAEGKTTIINAERLRLKESDRIEAAADVLRNLGALVNTRPDGLEIFGGHRLHGGRVSAHGDHRIAMMAAGLKCFCDGDIEIEGAECASKSYPGFWEDYRALGGQWEEI